MVGSCSIKMWVMGWLGSGGEVVSVIGWLGTKDLEGLAKTSDREENEPDCFCRGPVSDSRVTFSRCYNFVRK